MKSFWLLPLLFMLWSCGVPQKEYQKATETIDSLVVIVDSLKSQVDELQNGEARLIAAIELAIGQEDWIRADANIRKLQSRHPESSKCSFYKAKAEEIQPFVIIQQEAIEKAMRDSVRLANIDNLGNWEIKYYVDDFGEPTKNGYITYHSRIIGEFSNSATSNSILSVVLLFNENDYNIKLYEYGGNHPVKDSDQSYDIWIRDAHGDTHKIWGHNYSDRISVSSYEDSWLTNALLAGGTVKIRIKEDRKHGVPSEYSFEFNADFFDNAFIKLYGFEAFEKLEKDLEEWKSQRS